MVRHEDQPAAPKPINGRRRPGSPSLPTLRCPPGGGVEVEVEDQNEHEHEIVGRHRVEPPELLLADGNQRGPAGQDPR